MFGKKIRINTQSDEQLMRLMHNGQAAALEELYDRYFSKLVWFARGFLQSGEQAEDVVQDVFVKLMETPALFDPAKKFSTWIYVVTANACRQAIRNQNNRLRIISERFSAENDTTVMPEYLPDKEVINRTINQALDALSDKEKHIYRLRFVHEKSIKEIAEIMDIPEGSVKSGLFYLVKKFSTVLKSSHHE